MGQKFSSVSQEKINKEIERIAGEVYYEYFEKPRAEVVTKGLKTKANSSDMEKPNGTPQPSEKEKPNSDHKSVEKPEISGQKPEKQPETPDKLKETPQPTDKGKEKPKPSDQKPEEKPETSDKPTTPEIEARFHRAVCEVVGKLNEAFGYTQFKLPNTKNLQQAFEKHHKDGIEKVTKDEFQGMLQDILKTESFFTGFGAKDALVYIFSVPAAALLAKQRLFPRAMPNDVLIAGATSATVFTLAKLNKI